MASFKCAIFLLCLLLMTESLEETFGEEPPTQTPGTECDCKFYEGDWDLDYIIPPETEIDCKNINTKETMQCAHQFLKNSKASHRHIDYFHLRDSNLELFPDDFFAPYHLTEIKLIRCDIVEIPQRLITSGCDSLNTLAINGAPRLKIIPEGVFSKCPVLFTLELRENGIEEVSPKAFYGSRISRLDLAFNKISNFNGLEGIPKLSYLDISHNRIKYVDKNAFQNLTNLYHISLNNNELTTLEEGTFDWIRNIRLYVDLTVNPLNCNCSLKWLQDWFDGQDRRIWTSCSPDGSRILGMNISDCATTSNPLNGNCSLKRRQYWSEEDDADICELP